MSQAFRFNDLPQEIQLRIFEHTSLVSSTGNIVYEWGYFAERSGKVFKGVAAEYKRYQQRACTDEQRKLNRRLSYRRQHASSFKKQSRDRTWNTPTALFLVNHAFSEMAQRTLLSKNHVVISNYGPSSLERIAFNEADITLLQDLEENDTACKFSRFLADPTRSAGAESIRSIKIQWPMRCCAPDVLTTVLSHWGATIGRLGQSFRPRRLTIEVGECAGVQVNRRILDAQRVGGPGIRDASELWNDLIPSVNLFWPRERLGKPDGVQMFLWTSEPHSEGTVVAYYCRHLSEGLPNPLTSDFAPNVEEPWMGNNTKHTERTFQRSEMGLENGTQGTATSSPWVEGIFFRHDREFEYPLDGPGMGNTRGTGSEQHQ